MWSLKRLLNGTVAKSTFCTLEFTTRSIRIEELKVTLSLCIRESLHKDHVRSGRALSDGLQFRIGWISPPVACSLDRVKANDDDPIRSPISLKRLNLSATNQVCPSMHCQRRGHSLSVFGVSRFVVHLAAKHASPSVPSATQRITLSRLVLMLQMNSMH
jgi:hypothetical protein